MVFGTELADIRRSGAIEAMVGGGRVEKLAKVFSGNWLSGVIVAEPSHSRIAKKLKPQQEREVIPYGHKIETVDGTPVTQPKAP